MLLSHKTMIRLRADEANIIGHMCYAAYKLWNICNYERLHYQELNLEKYPDWYYQKSHHKDDLWYKSMPSQTAQEVCKQLDKAWRSYYALVKSGGIENPKPPRFKQEGICITYMQNGMKHRKDTGMIRLSLPKKLKAYMSETYEIDEKYLFLKNKIFQDIDNIKQIRMYPPQRDGRMDIIVIYEAADEPQLEDNGNYLSIDLGLHNLMTCYDSSGRAFILGRQYLSIARYYDKEIGRVQKEWWTTQKIMGIRYPKTSKHLQRLYAKKKQSIHDYLHKITHHVVEYCADRNINTLVIGDIRKIRTGNDLGRKTNQKLHALPYDQIYMMLEYKLARKGIRMIRQEESYSSQCSPYAPEVSAENAEKKNRIRRGLYQDNGKIFHADAVGAYNIMRKYHAVSGIKKELPVSGLNKVEIIKVAV
ncbi:MAG: transposase [Lachnospiraceae bacterium]|nr:transposase [Lachnospiraceae bacterium]